MATLVGTSLYNDLIEAYNRTAPAGGKLAEIRKEAIDIFIKKGFPSIKDEDWRFTSLVPYLNEAYVPVGLDGGTSPADITIQQALVPGLDGYWLVLVNGSIDFAVSHLPAAEFLEVQATANACNGNLFASYAAVQNHSIPNSMVALNSALFADGYTIELKKNAVLDKPLQILHIYTSQPHPSFYNPRHLVVARSGSRAELVETTVTPEGVQFFVNGVGQWQVEENAHITHYLIQNHEAGQRVLQYNHVVQHRNSRFDNFTFSLPGADLIRNNLEATLNGTGTETHLYGLYLVAGSQLTDNHTAIAHRYPHCQSNELYKGVLTDHGKAVFNGKVFVEREAQKTNAFQQNNNLLLSNKALVHAKPQLEIYADDVKCSHGCTIGQFDGTSLFYLRSRGIGEEAARKLLVEAFMFDVTEKIENEAVKEYTQQLIFEKMGNTLR